MDCEFMNFIAENLATNGINVARFEFPFQQEIRFNIKPKARKYVQGDVDFLRRYYRRMFRRIIQNDLPTFIGGSTLGGRIASEAAL
jgi:hypothetical protein